MEVGIDSASLNTINQKLFSIFETREYMLSHFQAPAAFRYASDQCKEPINSEKIPFDRSSMILKKHGRAILTDQHAREIYCSKPAPGTKDRTRAGSLSKIYGVSVKTIRDIWIGRTWYRATCHLDQTRPLSPERLQKKAGRPKGAKDSKKRVKKFPGNSTDMTSSFQETNLNPIMTAKGNEQFLTIAEDHQTKIEKVDVKSAAQIGTSEIDPILSIGPDFPEEFQTERVDEPFDDSWDSELWGKGDDDPFCLDTFDYCAPAFDPFEATEFDEPSRGFAEVW